MSLPSKCSVIGTTWLVLQPRFAFFRSPARSNVSVRFQPCVLQVCECGSCPLWALLFVSTKRNRGHIGSNTSNQSAANKAQLANDPGATGDRGRDDAARSLGVESGAAARREREPGVLLAEVVSRRAAGKQDGR